MDSKLNMRFTLALSLVAVLLSALCFYFGTGLYPRWWLMWIAAVPVLVAAPKLSWRAALLVAVAARILGGLNMWNYAVGRLRMPLPVVLASLLISGVLFALAVLLFRAFLRRRRPWLAALGFPSVIVACEYLIELRTGTFNNIAYTQLKDLPVLQLDAVTGMWGVSFLVCLFASAIAAIVLSRGRTRRQIALALVAILLCVLGYGAWRLRSTPNRHTITVGLVSTEFRQNIFPATDPQKIELARQYAARARALAAEGAKILVLPEMSMKVTAPLSGAIDRLFETTARESGAQILLGVLNETPKGTFNEARLYSASGTIEAAYRKRHLVPGAEAGTTPVNDASVLYQPIGTLGLAICRDMDYFDPARLYGKYNVGLLLVPAWDFNVDRLSHGHMAIMRGVDYGYSVVRSAKQGYLTVSDSRGRVLGEASTSPSAPFTTLLATVPIAHEATMYQALGDWFAWLNLGLLCFLVALFIAGRQKVSQADAKTAEVKAALY